MNRNPTMETKANPKPRKTIGEFVREAQAVHHDAYSYENTRYESWDVPVIIECPVHGEFKKIPAKHLAGQGCPQCSKLKRSLKRRGTTEEFIKKAKKVHQNSYCYEKAEYRAHNLEVEIICPQHGSFFQQAGVHIRGGGCPACARIRINDSKRDTAEEFVQKASKIHKDRYCYRNIRYINNSTPVTIECKVHGEFEQSPGNHLSGRGCPQCGVDKRSKQRRTTQKKFIEKASMVHGDRYSYEKAVYRTNGKLVEIVCPEHGSFFQQPAVHLSGRGCPQCGRVSSGDSKRKSIESFVEDAKQVHQDRYSYQKTEYKTCKIPVVIECREHGAFRQSPSNHLNGQGCPECAQLVRISKKRSNTADFVAKARNVHNDFYSYEKAVYYTNRQKLEIICPDHGSFFQTPDDHLSGCGCPVCADIKRQAARRKPMEQFVAEANTVHKHRYSYQKVLYSNAVTPVTIECPDHGEFTQSPDSHLQGSGCPLCGRVKRGLKRRSTLQEFIQNAKKVHNGFYSYEETIYQTSLQAVKIVCPDHGPFFQTPTDHLSGCGCQKCANNNRIESLRKTPEQFVNEANQVHKNRYSYRNSRYVDVLTPVIIECPIHGEFKRTPSIHLQGVGCPHCQKETYRLKRQKDFINNAREMHGNRYGYDLVHYLNGHTHVTIVCPVHGPYQQNPGSHLAGHHCMQCYLDLLKRGYFRETIRTCR